MDNDGNEIGREEHTGDTPEGFVGSPEHFSEDEGDHAPRIVRINTARLAELLHEAKKGKDE